MVAFVSWLFCHTSLFAQVPGICFPGENSSAGDSHDLANHASLMDRDTSSLVEYLQRQGYNGRTLEQAALADAANNTHAGNNGFATQLAATPDGRIRFQPSHAPHSLPSQIKSEPTTLATGIAQNNDPSDRTKPEASAYGSGSPGNPGPNRHEPADAPKQAFRMVSAATQPVGTADDDPLSSMGPSADAERERQNRKTNTDSNGSDSPSSLDPHAEVFANTLYPSALTCAKCHQKIYDEWRVSSHAYAAISPMFQRFEQLVTDLTRGTVGTFCMRCHAPVATQMNYPRQASLLEGPHVFREGITCVACHRVVERYGRVNGERRIEPGTVFDPVVGNIPAEMVSQRF